MKRVSTLLVVFAMTAMGCASYGGYRPTVDTYNNPNAQYLSWLAQAESSQPAEGWK